MIGEMYETSVLDSWLTQAMMDTLERARAAGIIEVLSGFPLWSTIIVQRKEDEDVQRILDRMDRVDEKRWEVVKP